MQFIVYVSPVHVPRPISELVFYNSFAPCEGTQYRYIQVLDSSIVSGTWILDSLSCFPDSKAYESGFHKQNFPGFQIHYTKFPLHGTNS